MKCFSTEYTECTTALSFRHLSKTHPQYCSPRITLKAPQYCHSGICQRHIHNIVLRYNDESATVLSFRYIAKTHAQHCSLRITMKRHSIVPENTKHTLICHPAQFLARDPVPLAKPGIYQISRGVRRTLGPALEAARDDNRMEFSAFSGMTKL